jgi:type I restriction enzyme S subunit
VSNVSGACIVIGRVGSYCGSTYYAPTSSWVTDNAIVATVDDPEETRYWYYVLNSLKLNTYRGGSGQPLLNQTILNSLKIMPAQPPERLAIAATLGAIDDKIESNRRATDLIERLSSSLLEETLDLDVYGHPEYDPNRRLGDILAVLETGSRPKGGASTDGVGVVSLGAESVQSAGIIDSEKLKTVPQEFADGMRRGRLENEDILVYKDGGKPGNFVPHISAFGYGFPVDQAVINEHVYRARAIDGVSQGLMYWLLRSPWMDQEMRKRGTGVAIPGLNSTNFRNLPMPILAPEVIGQLNNKLSPMLAGLLRYGAENKRLAALRDALLPELLSGRIRVPEAKNAVAEVVA